MVLEFFRGGTEGQLEGIHGQIVTMLQDCRHTFDLAINALLGGAEASSVGPEIHATDVRVNKAERAVRKKLVVHVSVRGAKADLPMVLAAMSIVKDAERIGDYCKNIWDLANEGVSLAGGDDEPTLVAYRDRTSQAIGEAAGILSERDADRANELIKQLDVYRSEYDDAIDEQVHSTGTPREAVPRALLFRYLKRITAHLMNVLTSLVMPVHRLDYYDEDKADRI
jgi:phosphate transport system protein